MPVLGLENMQFGWILQECPDEIMSSFSKRESGYQSSPIPIPLLKEESDHILCLGSYPSQKYLLEGGGHHYHQAGRKEDTIHMQRHCSVNIGIHRFLDCIHIFDCLNKLLCGDLRKCSSSNRVHPSPHA